MKKSVLILAIETSCDETAAAVLSVEPSPQPSPIRLHQGYGGQGGRGSKDTWPKIKTLSSVVKSQISIHKSFGGVVPETAARAHVKNILPVVQKTINNSRLTINDIDYIAITNGPGLIPSLIVGVEFARALSLATGKPIIPVNHMMGHLYSPFKTPTLPSPEQPSSVARLHSRHLLPEGEENNVKAFGRGKPNNVFPIISLIVSGGHTILALMKNIKEYQVLGQTVDDAAGEAFDKVAKLLGLPYPGGPEVSRLAEKSKSPVLFPRPMINSKNYNFSFSGLKTAVLYYLRDHSAVSPSFLKRGSGGVKNLTANICAGFQEATVDVLVTKTLRAAIQYKAQSISLSGGVAANKKLRKELIVNCQRLNVKFFAPPKNLCTDNAEMIGLAAGFMLYNGFKPKSFKTIKANSNLNL
jgi:N6-L-threonylcarbamoyladenine synthase